MNNRPVEYNTDQTIELILAARIGNIEGALHALKKGAHVNGLLPDKDMVIREAYQLTASDRTGTALHIAVNYEHVDMVKLLLNKKARKEINNTEGDTPLLIAVKKRNIDIASLLLKHKADSNAKDKDGKTPLLIARLNNEKALIDLLLQYGADVNYIDEWMKYQFKEINQYSSGDDATNLSLVINYLINTHIISPHELYEELVKDDSFKNRIVHTKNGPSCIVLMKVIDFLLESGIADVSRLLPEKYIFANLNLKDDLFKHIKTFPLSERIKRYDGILHNTDSPYYKIFHMKRGYIVGVSEKRGILHNVVKEYRSDAVDIERFNRLNDELLYASLSMNIKKMRACIHQGANVNFYKKNHCHQYPIISAAFKGHFDAVKLLVESGADVNAMIIESEIKCNVKATALFICASKGHQSIVEFLLENNANVNAMRERDNATSLMIAIDARHTNIVKILLLHNAEIDVFGNARLSFKSPLALSVKNGSQDILRLLVDHLIAHYSIERIKKFMQSHDNLKVCLQIAVNDEHIHQLTRIIDHLTFHGISKDDIQAMLPDGFAIPEKPVTAVITEEPIPVRHRLYPVLTTSTETLDETLQQYIDSVSKRVAVAPETVILNPFTGEALPIGTASTEPASSDKFSAIEKILSAETVHPRPAYITALDEIDFSQTSEQSSTAHVLTQLGDLMTFEEPVAARPYHNPFDALCEQMREADIAAQLDNLPPAPARARLFTADKNCTQEQPRDKQRVMLLN